MSAGGGRILQFAAERRAEFGGVEAGVIQRLRAGELQKVGGDLGGREAHCAGDAGLAFGEDQHGDGGAKEYERGRGARDDSSTTRHGDYEMREFPPLSLLQ